QPRHVTHACATTRLTMTAQIPVTDRLLEDHNAATGDKLFQLAQPDLSRINEVVDRARQAQTTRAAVAFTQRARHIHKVRDYIAEHAEELATVVSRSNGKARVDALATEVLPCALACNWYAGNAEKVLKPKMRGGGNILFFNKRSQIVHVPIGVVGIISPRS